MSQPQMENLEAEAGDPAFEGIHPEVERSRELVQRYSNPRYSWAQKFKEAQEFRSGAQWTQEQTEILKKRGQNPIVVNRMHPIVETAKALLAYNKPSFRATGREDSDTRVAKIMSDLFTWIWENSDGNSALKRVIDDYYVGGMGVLQVYQDPHADMGKGEVLVEAVNPLDLYIDPNSKDNMCRDAANILIVKIITEEQAYNTYPEFSDIIEAADKWDTGDASSLHSYPITKLDNTESQTFLGDFSDDGVHKKVEFIERYTRIKVDYFHTYDPNANYEQIFNTEEKFSAYGEQPAVIVEKEDNPGNREIVTVPEGVNELLQIIEQTGGVFHMIMPPPQIDPMSGQPMGEPQPQMVPGPASDDDPMVIPGSTTYLKEITKSELMQEGEIYVNKIAQDRIKVVVSAGDRLLYTRILPCEDYPIVVMMNIHDRNPYPESDVRIYRPLQEYVNKIRSLIIAHASTSTNVKLLVPRGSVNKREIEEEWGKAGTAVIEFDGELGTPVVAGPIPLPNELYKNEADAKHDLEYGFGIFEMMQGSAKTAPSTYRGTVVMDEFGQRRIKSRRDDMEQVLNQVAIVAIPLIQQLYTEEKIIRLIQPNNITQETQINQAVYDEFTGDEIGKINDITVGMYDIVVVAGSTLPSNRWALLDTYMQMFQAGLIDQTEVLKKTEIVDAEGVLERMSMINQLQSQISSLVEENKKLSGDLQTAERESVHAKKRVEVEKFKTDLHKSSTDKRVEVEKFKTDLHKSSTEVRKAAQLYESRLGDELAKIKATAIKPRES